MIPEVILTVRARLGERPCWDAQAQCLYWVDIYNHRVHQFDPKTEQDRFFDVGEVVTCFAPASNNRLIIALRQHLAFLDTQTGTVTRLVELDKPSDIRFNDGKCDRLGRFWVGTLCISGPNASLYRYDPDGTLNEMETGLNISNGLGWSLDQQTFYLTDSKPKIIYAYDFDLNRGNIENRRVFIDLSEESFGPDGLTVDSEGCIWSAMWDGWCIIRFDPNGKEMLRVSLPVPRPSSCTFGGPALTTLYITTASIGLSEKEIQDSIFSGDLFAVETPVKGTHTNYFGVGKG
ncbi:gluconolaconase [Aphanothece hegewaldii CCALA 016]|uniref:Gluconolaconase n=1 Tax=Aphanothece hegewaldii CCALA 016 TaxID=2107694 RepID=A0A2T1LWN3_9CHRO|nr:SMP-30/gluconolactonase/LRE family protein [Aphanothece hegewaldii]PSF36304.1 gluconolaconase [Aphanothece hegewaldii CCALA 016]